MSDDELIKETMMLDYSQLVMHNVYMIKENKRLNKIRQQVIDELFDLKNMIYKPETREINFDIQNKISSIIKILGSDKE